MRCATYITSASFKRREDVKHIRNVRTASRQEGKSTSDILNLAVWDDKLGAEFKKLKGDDNIVDMYVEEGKTWDLENTTK